MYIWKAVYNNQDSLLQIVIQPDGTVTETPFEKIEQAKLKELQVFDRENGTIVITIMFPKAADLIIFKRKETYYYGYKILVKRRSVKKLIKISNNQIYLI